MEQYSPLEAWGKATATAARRRIFVEYLADRMEETLQRNDIKPAWELEAIQTVMNKLQEEIMEFLDAMLTKDSAAIEAEGIDVIIMVGATMAKFVPAMAKWRRGREE